MCILSWSCRKESRFVFAFPTTADFPADTHGVEINTWTLRTVYYGIPAKWREAERQNWNHIVICGLKRTKEKVNLLSTPGLYEWLTDWLIMWHQFDVDS